MKVVFTIAISLLTFAFGSEVSACSCDRIASIREAIKTNPIVLHVKVIDVTGLTHAASGRDVVLRVVRVLKGRKLGKQIAITWDQCYRSIGLKDFKLGLEYILPISGEERNGKFTLLKCSHSGLARRGASLYTYELAEDGGRELKYYAEYAAFMTQFIIEPNAAGNYFW